MPRCFVVSTVGIGIFLNSLEPAERPEWHGRLMELSNTKDLSSNQDAFAKVQELQERALTRLIDGDAATRRRFSPELNGLYGLYDNRLSSDADIHCLISTDTAIGRDSAQILQQYLDSQGLKTGVFIPEGLNTATVGGLSEI